MPIKRRNSKSELHCKRINVEPAENIMEESCSGTVNGLKDTDDHTAMVLVAEKC